MTTTPPDEGVSCNAPTEAAAAISARRARPRLPLGVVALAVPAVVVVLAPLVALVVRAPWGRMWVVLTGPAVRTALGLSLGCSLAATACAVVVGVPLAWVLARGAFRGRSVLRALVVLPVVVPPVVGGVALLLAFGRRGIFGAPLSDWFGFGLPFGPGGVVVAELFVAMPFLVVSVEAALRGLDPGREDAARTLGADAWTVWWRVTLPQIRPALLAGMALCWARAMGEFGATITFAGNVAGRTQTAPLAVFGLFEGGDLDAAVALGLALVAVCAVVLVVLRRHWIPPFVGALR